MSNPGEFKVLATTALSTVLKACLPTFDRANNVATTAVIGSTNRILDSVRAGETADLIIATTGAIDELTREGKIISGTRTDLASAGIGVCVRKGAARPDIATLVAFKQTLLGARSIASSQTGQSGIHFAKVVEQLGIAAEVKAKTVISSGGLVGNIVARGDAEIGIQQTSEILAVSGVDLIGLLPDDVQLISVFAAGIGTGSEKAQLSQQFLSRLCSPDGARILREKGLTPCTAG
jgi:molybdate transport system substrate-binding protein